MPCRPTGWLWPVVSAAGAALVERAGPRADNDQSSTDPPRAHAPGGGSARGGGAGYDPARTLEVWLAGIVVAGRTLPIGWAVIPYPWPKGRFRATTLALIQQLQRAFPAGGRWTLVADRGFPSAVLFAQLRQGGTDFSVRLRLSDWVTVARVYATVSAHLAAGRLVVGQWTAATMGRGTVAQPLVPAAVVVSAAVVTPPRHKQNPGTARERTQRAKQHAQHRKHKQGRKTTPPSTVAQRYAQTWILFTTASTVAQAVAEYAGRMSIEETYRDWHHYWAVRAAVVDLPTEAMVARLIGVVCLAYTVQMHLGQRVSADPMAAATRSDRHRPGELVLVRSPAV